VLEVFVKKLFALICSQSGWTLFISKDGLKCLRDSLTGLGFQGFNLEEL